MMLRLTALIVSTSCFAVSQGPLRFEVKRVERKTAQCVITIEYPEIISAATSQARDRMNAGILRALLRIPQWPPAPDSGIRSLEGYIDRYLKQCESSHDGPKAEPPGRGLYEHKRITIFRYTAPILSFRCDADDDGGGVHPYGATFFANFYSSTGRTVLLSDLLREGMSGKFESVAEAKFRRDHDLAPSGSLSENGFSFPADHFKLNENLGIGEDELVFICNTYEISAGAMGATEIRLPYQTIRELLKPGLRLCW